MPTMTSCRLIGEPVPMSGAQGTRGRHNDEQLVQRPISLL